MLAKRAFAVSTGTGGPPFAPIFGPQLRPPAPAAGLVAPKWVY